MVFPQQVKLPEDPALPLLYLYMQIDCKLGLKNIFGAGGMVVPAQQAQGSEFKSQYYKKEIPIPSCS
jgi:hypothetical protein